MIRFALFLVTVATLSLAGCAAPDAASSGSAPSGSPSDNTGFIPNQGFVREGDPTSRHQSYLRKEL